jgi:cellulose synthase/poly-beta-1,6-N-acetylglucosamine synthase-like glycosyltransferase
METLFFVLLFLTFYPYLIYPLLVTIWSRVTVRAWPQVGTLPRVSMIISVFNEEGVIREKIANSLALDYPEESLEIVVVSDGSTDDTNQIVDSIDDPRLVLRAFPMRRGKTACLNEVIPAVKGEILLFTDANSMFPSDNLLKITRNFSDHQIGLVTGWTKYRKAEGVEETTGLYSRLERVTKYGESLISSCVGADGAVFAMRKALYLPLRDYDINDFVIPLKVIVQGRRVVLDPEVCCIEQSSEDVWKEFRRQVRITNRTLGAIWRHIAMLNPVTNGSFALFLLSHKVIRFLVPLFFMATFCTGLILAGNSMVYAGFAAAQILFVVVGVFGIFEYLRGRLATLCSFILLTFLAQLVGWLRWVTGKSDVMWKPER